MRRAQLRSYAVTFIVVAGLSACQSTRRHELPIAGMNTAVAGGRPVRLTFLSGSEISLSGVRVFGDSLVGDVGSPPTRFATAISDVRSIDERSGSTKRNVALGIGGTLLTGLAIATVAAIGVFYLILHAAGG